MSTRDDLELERRFGQKNNFNLAKAVHSAYRPVRLESGGEVPILRESDRQEVRRRLEGLKNPVKLFVFTQTINCPYCPPNQQLAEEVGSLSNNIQVEVLNAILDKERVQAFGVDKVPAMAVVGAPLAPGSDHLQHPQEDLAPRAEFDYGIRFYGVPAGYEFVSFLEAIRRVSAGDSGLSPESREALAKIGQPVHLQVFTTPT